MIFTAIARIGLGNWINMYQTLLSIVFVICILLFYLAANFLGKTKHLRLISIALLFVYIAGILCKTVIFRNGSSYGVDLEFLWSYKVWLAGNKGTGNQIFLNILLYIPLGCFGTNAFSETKHGRIIALLIGLAVSITTEVCQYCFKVGLFEFDDMLNNFMGTAIGVLAAVIIGRMGSDKVNENKY